MHRLIGLLIPLLLLAAAIFFGWRYMHQTTVLGTQTTEPSYSDH